jgi:hypothetical protein
LRRHQDESTQQNLMTQFGSSRKDAQAQTYGHFMMQPLHGLNTATCAKFDRRPAAGSSPLTNVSLIYLPASTDPADRFNG